MRFNIKTILLTVLFCVPAFLNAQVRIESIDALENQISSGAEGQISLDIIQGKCGTNCASSGNSCSDEPFGDTFMRIKVYNRLNSTIHFSKGWFVIPNPYGTGGRLTTKRFALVSTGNVPYSKTEPTTLYLLFLDMHSGLKSYAGETTTIPDDLGFRNIKVFLQGKTASGRTVRISTTGAFSFGNIDRC